MVGAGVCALALSAVVRADKYWVGTGTGFWSDPANWSDVAGGTGGAGMPAPEENAFMKNADELDRTLTIDVPATVSGLVILNDGSGVNSVSQGAGVNLTTNVTHLYGTLPDAHSSYLQTGGVHSTRSLIVGGGNSNAKNSTAIYTMDGGTLSTQGIMIAAMASIGTFEQNGGYVSANSLQIAQHPENGYYLLNDGTLATQSTYVGSSGKGTFIQSGGTHITSYLVLSESNTTSKGTYLLNGPSATLIVNGHERIADRDVGTFIQSAGTHLVTRGLWVSHVGEGTFILNGGILTVLGGDVVIAELKRGTFIQTGGKFVIGSPESPQNFYTSKGYGTPGTFMFSGADSSLTIHGNDYAHLLSQSSGKIVVSGSFYGGSCEMSGGSLTVGGNQFYGGTFSQTGGAVTLTSPDAAMLYTNYSLGGGRFSAPTLRPSYGFVWSAGALDIGILHLVGSTTVSLNSGNTLSIKGLTGSTGTLNLTNNNMVIDYDGDPTAELSSLRTNLLGGHVRTGLADSAHRLGYGDNADPLLQLSSFSGETFPAGDFTQLLVKYTFGGDANLDGSVNITDLLALSDHWQGSNAFWTEGDFNYDGLVDAKDLGILAANWQASEASLNAAVAEMGVSLTAIPEPATAASATLAVLAMAAMRRRGRVGGIALAHGPSMGKIAPP